ncbi:MAG: translation elongation factor Ts [Actinobacteria bacterium]|nr:translation elongation factor Ts [Actinomycetota bacterium]
MSDPGSISAGDVKRLRDLTGAGMMDCKKALVEAAGDVSRAQEILREKGLAGAKKRSGRQAAEGLIDAYIHGEGRIGVLVEVNSETDFVGRTQEFRRLAREVAMQVAARDPRWVSRDDVPPDVAEGERKIYLEQARALGKPESVLQRIVEGKLENFYKETVLLDQPYIREDSRTVGDFVNEVAAKVGENVVVRRFARFVLGEEA